MPQRPCNPESVLTSICRDLGFQRAVEVKVLPKPRGTSIQEGESHTKTHQRRKSKDNFVESHEMFSPTRRQTLRFFKRQKHAHTSCKDCAQASKREIRVVLTAIDPLSLGRVVQAPHTRHLLGLFAAIAQNSLLRSLSIVDSFARKQHYCRGSEELAIPKSARFRATPSCFAGLRATPSGGRPRTPSYSELLRATASGY